MKTLYKSEIIELLEQDCVFSTNTKEFIEEIFTNFIDLVKAELKKGNSISLLNFGKLVPKKYNRVNFTDPRTKLKITKDPRVRIIFMEAPALKKSLKKPFPKKKN